MKKIFAVLVASVVLTGCTTVTPMAFDKNATKVDTTSKSVVLVAIDVTRPDGSRYVPDPHGVRTDKAVAQGERQVEGFKLDKETDTVQFRGKTLFLARMAMEPGEHKLLDVWGVALGFPFVGNFNVPLRTTFNVAPNSVTYLGHVSATLRPRVGEEFRAGPLIPLIDQAATGMSKSTWDVTISDKAEEDLALFRANFPVLRAVKIESAILPAFDRVAVQRWYDNGETAEQKAEPAAPADKTASR